METETIEEPKIETAPEEKKDIPPVDDLQNDFEEFKKSTSEHKAEPVTEENTENTEHKTTTVTNKSNEVFDNMKLKMFMGLFFALIDGVHLIVYRFISKYELTKEDLALDETDHEGLQMYFQTPRIMNFINSIPVEIMGFIHLEWLYLQKYQDVVKVKEEEEAQRQKKIAILKKIKNKNNPKEEEEQEEEEPEEQPEEQPEEEETEEEKPKPKRKYKKRKRGKYKPRKKVEPIKE